MENGKVFGVDAGIGGKWGKFVNKSYRLQKNGENFCRIFSIFVFLPPKKILDDETQVPQIEN